MKPPALIKAVTECCLVCLKPESCWSCVFRQYVDDVLLELERRRFGNVNLSEARERLFQFAAPGAGGAA